MLFASLPPAALNYLLAERYSQEPERVASLVLIGNAFAILFVPLGLTLASTGSDSAKGKRATGEPPPTSCLASGPAAGWAPVESRARWVAARRAPAGSRARRPVAGWGPAGPPGCREISSPNISWRLRTPC